MDSRGRAVGGGVRRSELFQSAIDLPQVNLNKSLHLCTSFVQKLNMHMNKSKAVFTIYENQVHRDEGNY